MVGSGLFMLPVALAFYGGISLVGWLISGVGAFFLALVFGWLSKLMPVANGGPYAYSRAGLGDFAGFLVAWGYWISIWCTNAAVAIAFVSYLSTFFPILAANSLAAVTTGLTAIWFLTWINTRGIREAAFVQVLTTILKLTPLLLISVAGLFFINTDHFSPFNISSENNWQAIVSCSTLTLFAFLGLESATIPSGDTAQPEKTVAKATLAGTLIVTLVYILGTVSVMGIIEPAQLQHSNAPFADAASALWGEQAKFWVSLGAIVATFGALNGWILIQGQIPAAAAVDRLMPAYFGNKNKRGVPAFSIVIGSVLVSVLMGMNFSRTLADTYKFVILLSTLTSLLAFLFSMASYVIIGSQKKVLTHTRLAVALLAFLFSLWAVIGSGQESVFWGFVLLMGGVPFYVLMKK